MNFEFVKFISWDFIYPENMDVISGIIKNISKLIIKRLKLPIFLDLETFSTLRRFF